MATVPLRTPGTPAPGFSQHTAQSPSLVCVTPSPGKPRAAVPRGLPKLTSCPGQAVWGPPRPPYLDGRAAVGSGDAGAPAPAHVCGAAGPGRALPLRGATGVGWLLLQMDLVRGSWGTGQPSAQRERASGRGALGPRPGVGRGRDPTAVPAQNGPCEKTPGDRDSRTAGNRFAEEPPWGPRGSHGGRDSLRGGVHATLPGSSRGVVPLPLATSMAESRSCIHFSFSSRELRGGAEAQDCLQGTVRVPPCTGLGGLGQEVGCLRRPVPVLWV